MIHGLQHHEIFSCFYAGVCLQRFQRPSEASAMLSVLHIDSPFCNITLMDCTDYVHRTHAGVGTHKRKAKHTGTANVIRGRGINRQYRFWETDSFLWKMSNVEKCDQAQQKGVECPNNVSET